MAQGVTVIPGDRPHGMERPGHLTAGRGETHLPHGFFEDKCGTQLPNEALSLSWDRTPLAGGMSKLPLRQSGWPVATPSQFYLVEVGVGSGPETEFGFGAEFASSDSFQL